MHEPTDAELDGRLLHRMVFFSDAVFAIVLTLLVLELRPPEVRDTARQAQAFAELGPHFLAFSMSFGLIAIFWAAHMNTLRRIVRFDWATAWTNLLFLFPVCLVPFVSAWYGQGLGAPFIWGVYCAVLTAISAFNVALVLVSARGRGRLLAGGVTGREKVYRVARASSPGLAFGAGLLLLATRHDILAQFCWALIPLIFLFCELALKPRPAPGPTTKAAA
ncbi:MAG: hypothetical protein JWQ29_3435 [Phenylobacterium sp.]|nr:hypothetical protein [Phenylobacterium sp.]